MTDIPAFSSSMPPFMGDVSPMPLHPKIELLRKVLQNYNLERTAGALAGMLTVPVFQANAYRLELLAHIAISSCAGKTRPEPRHLDTWLNRQLGVREIALMEDPSEDAFVLTVLTSKGDFRIFPGRWETVDTPTTYIVAAVESMFKGEPNAWLDEVLSLLQLSDAAVERSGLPRWAHEPSQDKGPLSIHFRAPLDEWRSRVTFSSDQLAELGVSEDLLKPFIFDLSQREELTSQSPQESQLHCKPLLRVSGGLLLAIPSAVAYAVRRHLVLRAAQEGRLGELQAALMHHAQARVFSLSTHGSRHGADLLELPADLHGVDSICSSVVVQVGKRRFLHFLLIAEDVQRYHEHGMSIPGEPSSTEQEAIWEHVERVRQHLASTQEVDSGHTFYISGLLGGGFMMRRPSDSNRWTMMMTTLGDLELLLMDSESPIDRLIYLLNQRAHEEAKGLHLPFDNGILNLYAYWLQQGFMLRPREARYDQPVMVQIGTDHVLPYRLDRRRIQDEHCEPIRDRFTVVQRANAASIYRSVRGLPVYVSMDLLARGTLAFSIKASTSTLWVIVREAREPRARKAAFELWEGLQLFLYRAIESGLTPPSFKSHSPQVVIDLSRIALRTEETEMPRGPEGAAEHVGGSDDSLMGLQFNDEGSLAVLNAGPAFLTLFEGVENKGEQYLVTSVLKAAWSLSEAPPPTNEDLHAHALQVLGGTGARVLHTLRVRSAAENLEVKNGGRVYGHPTECIAAAMHTAFTWRTPPDETVDIPRQESMGLLNEAVLQHAVDLQSTLQGYNRAALIADLLERYETLLRDKMRWRATARAVRSLYGPEEGTQAASDADQRRAQTGIGLRALIEAATCECADSDGLLPDGHRVDALVARMMLIINMGRDSDVAHFGLATRGIRLYPNGSYSLDADVFGQIAKPFLGETFGGSYAAAARDYESWFHKEPTEPGQDEPSFFDDPAFQQAWLREYGHPFSAFRQIAGELEDIAVSQNSPVVVTSVEAVLRARIADGVTEADVRAFLSAFGLPRCVFHPMTGTIPR